MKTLLISTLILLSIIGNGQEQKQPCKLNIQIEGLKTEEGTIMLEIIKQNEETFKSLEQKLTQNSCQFTQQLPQGEYMVQYYHDANNNKKMDKMIMGIPKEGYGFSNNPDSKYGPPAMEEMLFTLTSDTLIVINNVQW